MLGILSLIPEAVLPELKRAVLQSATTLELRHELLRRLQIKVETKTRVAVAKRIIDLLSMDAEQLSSEEFKEQVRLLEKNIKKLCTQYYLGKQQN